MKRFSATRALFIGGLLLVIPACTTPGTSRRAGEGGHRGVAAAIGSPKSVGSQATRSAAGPLDQRARRAGPDNPAAASTGSVCPCGVCADQPTTTTRPSAPAVAGHRSHRSHSGAQRPHGHAPIPPVPNAYGIDRQEFLCDGGDQPPEASLRRDDSIAGLQPEDTVVHYTTESGDIEFDASNPVCVYSPRFASVRKITGAASGGRAVGAAGLGKPVGPNRLEYDLPGLVVAETTELGHAERTRRPDSMRDRNRGVPIEGILQPVQTEEIMAAVAGLSIQEINRMKDAQLALLEKASQAAVTWTIDESVEVAIEDVKTPTLVRDQQLEAFTVYEFPEAGRLRICKLADRADAAPGDEVNFTLRVDNVGDSPVNHVTITDNLTTRLEYVDGSQTSSVEAEFETFANDAQSLRLQWTLQEELKVGESAILRFTTRVR